MNLSYLNKYVNFILFILLLYCLFVLSSHYIIPNLGEMSISVDTNTLNPEFQNIIISIDKVFPTYYILVYESTGNSNWIYCSSSKYENDISSLIENFIDTTKTKYLIFQGNKDTKDIKFTIKSKHTSNYMTDKDNLFHIYYIVPYRIFPFYNFYYSKHFYFFVNTIT